MDLKIMLVTGAVDGGNRPESAAIWCKISSIHHIPRMASCRLVANIATDSNGK